jgi:hypothetical protein
MLKGLLVDTCGVHALAQSPHQIYEALIETMKVRLGQKWPLFVAYVATHDEGPPLGTAEEGSPPSHWLQHLKHGIIHTASANSVGESGVLLPARADLHELWELLDDVFVAWLAQQNATMYPAAQTMDELRFFGLALPVVRTGMEGLRKWESARIERDKPGFLRAARRDAHHLVILLELPDLRKSWELDMEETLALARTVVAHPRTFNMSIRVRARFVLEGGTITTGKVEHALEWELDDEHFARFESFAATPRDAGRLGAFTLSACKEKSPPWLPDCKSKFRSAQVLVRPSTGRDLDHWDMKDLNTAVRHPCVWKI